MIPFGEIVLARAISFLIARRLAAPGSRSKSSSRNPIWAVEMIPTPPWAATVPANRPRLIPTPMPPWISGTLTSFSPILHMASPFLPQSFTSYGIFHTASRSVPPFPSRNIFPKSPQSPALSSRTLNPCCLPYNPQAPE